MSPFCCARATLAVQAQGTPLSHKKYFVMLAHFRGVICDHRGICDHRVDHRGIRVSVITRGSVITEEYHGAVLKIV